MKILHVISSPASGGAEVYVKDLVIELKKQGYYVAIGFLEHASDALRSQEYEDLFLSELNAASVPYFFIGHETRKKVWLGAWRVRKFIVENNINMYHAHLPYCAFFGFFLQVPRIYTHHSIKARMSSFQYFFLNRLVDAYIGISELCSRNLESYTKRKVKTILNAVDFNKIKTLNKSDKNGSTFQALAVGRIHPHKNYLFMLEAVSRLPEQVKSNFHLKIAGEGELDEKQKILDSIEDNALHDIVSLLGNRSDIPDLLAESDVFLMSSIQEGLPIALIEAAATGLPCLVTDVGGCSEVINICENGFFVEADDFYEYSKKLTELVNNKALRQGFSDNALVKSTVFSIKNSAEEHVSIYNKLLSKNKL